MEILLYANRVFFFFFFDRVVSGNILCVNSTLKRHHVIQDFVSEGVEHIFSRKSSTPGLKGMRLGAD